jgi:hypothetical protein
MENQLLVVFSGDACTGPLDVASDTATSPATDALRQSFKNLPREYLRFSLNQGMTERC